MVKCKRVSESDADDLVNDFLVNKVMQGLAHDLRRDGITVVSMHPGWVQTDMGGPGADITARESASGILGVADRLELADSGSFFNYDGSAIAW